MTDAAIATISIIIVVHGILLFRLGRGLTWWLGRLLDAAEAFQHAVWFGFVPMVKVLWQHFGEAHARLTAKEKSVEAVEIARCAAHNSFHGTDCDLPEGHKGPHIGEDGLSWLGDSLYARGAR